MIAVVLCSFLVPSQKVFAHDAYVVQSYIDDGSMQYKSITGKDPASFWNKESKHKEAQLGNFTSLIGNEETTNVTFGASTKKETGTGTDGMPFTFPALETTKTENGKKNDATSKDIERAFAVSDTLFPSLNEAIRIVNGGTTPKTLEELQTTVQGLLSGSHGGYSISYGTSETITEIDAKTGVGPKDYALIKGNGKTYELPYRVPKGYLSDDYNGWKSSVYDPKSAGEYKGKDVDYITWHMLVYQANYNYAVNGFTSNFQDEVNKPNILEQGIVTMAENFIDMIRSALGLASITDLIFNEGQKNKDYYIGGVIPASSEDIIMIFFGISMAIAWALIIIAVGKMLLLRNLSTINPVMRVSLIDGIKDLIVTGFLLTLTLPIIRLMLEFNVILVDIFSEMAGGEEFFDGLNNYTGVLSGVILQAFYLFIMIYLNVFYLLRQIITQFLIALGPLFVVSIAFGQKWSGYFGAWAKELTANIFIQAIHAFSLPFILMMASGGKIIESLVACYALIPITSFAKNLIFGSEGGLGEKLTGNAIGQGVSALKANAKYKMYKGKSNSSSSQNSGAAKDQGSLGDKDGAGRSAEMNENVKPSSSKVDKHSAESGTSQTYHSQGSVNSQNTDAGTLDAYTKSVDANDKSLGGKDRLKTFTQQAKNNFSNYKNSGELAKDGKAFVKGAGKVGMGLTSAMAGVGAGVGLASVGADSSAAFLSARKGLDKASGVLKGGINQADGRIQTFGGNQNTNQLSAENSNPVGMLQAKPIAENIRSNGDFETHYNRKDFQNEGINGVNTTKDNMRIAYNMDQLNNIDKENLTRASQEFASAQNGSQESANLIKNAGISNISTGNNPNEIIVNYNQTGMSNLGVKSLQRSGDRIIEVRDANQTKPPLKTVPIK